MLQAFPGRDRAVGVWRREAAGVVELAGAAEVGAFAFEAGFGDFQRFAVGVGDEQVAGRPALVHCSLGGILGESRVQHGFAVSFQTGLQRIQRLDADHDGATDFSHIDGGCLTDAGANERRMRLLIRAGAQQGKFEVPVFAAVRQILAGPGLDQHLFRFIEPGDALLHGEAEAQVLIVVVGRAAPGSDDEPAVAEVVEKGRFARRGAPDGGTRVRRRRIRF